MIQNEGECQVKLGLSIEGVRKSMSYYNIRIYHYMTFFSRVEVAKSNLDQIAVLHKWI